MKNGNIWDGEVSWCLRGAVPGYCLVSAHPLGQPGDTAVFHAKSRHQHPA